MPKETALIFGLNKYALEIAQNVTCKYENVIIYALDGQKIPNLEIKTESFDLSDEWSDLDENIDIQNSIAFCVLEDSAESIFLTISLRAHFKDLSIIAIASNNESANKLEMAGANKVIPLVETTAEIISNILEKPITNKVFHGILYDESLLKVEQVLISNAMYFENQPINEIDWSEYKGIIMLSVMHEDMSHEFIYAKKLQSYIIKNGDILVVVGYEGDIEEFKREIGSV